ncbi:MAG: SDR family NAD(P)-dependent oxidoreductase [Pseudomonadales bacterium]
MVNVVVTGGSKGIGLGLAEEFLRRGANVAIAGRDANSLEAAVAKLRKLACNDQQVTGHACDVTDYLQVRALWQLASSNFGKIDMWLNNAGLARTTWAIKDVPQGEVEAMVTTNMLGTINGCRVAVDGMLAQGGVAKIFNILGGGSDGEYFPGMGIYGTTKRGLDYFTNALVKELKDTDIIVGKIRPGMIITDAVIREAQEDMDNFQKSRKVMNNLVDKIETVAPYLVEEMLKTTESGHKIAWLNGKKIGMRMLKARFRSRPDLFAEFGL